MEKDYIVVLDSGIGGLSVLKELQKNIRGETFIYYGDNLNAPYGNKTKAELLYLVTKNLINLPFNIKAIVLACNTLSVTIREELEQIYNVPVFAVFPPYQRCIMDKKRTLVLATKRTAFEIETEIKKQSLNFINNLVTIVGLECLATDIEKLFPNVNAINLNKHFFNYKMGENCAFERIILGCTHYNLIEKQIFNYFRPLETISGITLTTQKIKEWLCRDEIGKNTSVSQVIFYGVSKNKNKNIFEKVVNII